MDQKIMVSVINRNPESFKASKENVQFSDSGIIRESAGQTINWEDIEHYYYEAESTSINLAPTGSSLEFKLFLKNGESIHWEFVSVLKLKKWKSVMSAVNLCISNLHNRITMSYLDELKEKNYITYKQYNSSNEFSTIQFHSDGNIFFENKLIHYSSTWKVINRDDDPFMLIINDVKSFFNRKNVAIVYLNIDYFSIKSILSNLYKWMAI